MDNKQQEDIQGVHNVFVKMVDKVMETRVIVTIILPEAVNGVIPNSFIILTKGIATEGIPVFIESLHLTMQREDTKVEAEVIERNMGKIIPIGRGGEA